MTQIILKGFKQTKIGVIPEEWEFVDLGEISKFKYGLGESSQDKGEYLYIRITDINTDGSLKKSNLVYISKDKVSEKDILKKGDILVARTGASYGKSYIFKENLKSTFGGFLIKLILNDKKINNYFLFSFMRSNLYWGQANNLVGGGAQPQFNANTICKLKLPLPPLPQQKAIAEILSSLDDKIELLEKQNKTLENIGQAIFKSWFVDFKGFENDLVESEMGMIPRGWKIGKVEDYVNFIVDNRGKTPSTILPGTDGIIPMIEINSLIGKGRNINIELIKKGVTEEIYNSWFRKGHPERGDILFSTVGSIGEIGLVYDEKICIAQNIVSLRPNVGGEFLYELLKNIKPKLLGLDISTVQPSIKLPHLLNFEVLIPDNKIIDYFINNVRNSSEKININKKQIQMLSNLRNSLLPRLMNGKVRVKI